jgi:hypothetical protein
VFKKLEWDESQVRTIGSGSIWGGVLGGFLAEAILGADSTDPFSGLTTVNHPGASGILVGASIGSVVGAVGGGALANDHTFTRGDVALIDTFAGMGAVGGLTVGMLMQPAQKEAYSINGILGAAGGLIAGYVVAPQTNTTPRRMLRVAGLAAAGGAVPFLLYAAIRTNSSTADERVTGALSTAGLVGGAWLGFYLTRDMDVGLDVPDSIKKIDDAPPAVIGRSSDGSWGFGGLAVSPLSTRLAPQRGMALTLLGATF